MPTKFVQNTAHRMGVSVEHAEKVWHDAKEAVTKGKRQGSWYWGKVVNTFKRMMGVKESMTFKDFMLVEDELEWPRFMKLVKGWVGQKIEEDEHSVVYELTRVMAEMKPGFRFGARIGRDGGLWFFRPNDMTIANAGSMHFSKAAPDVEGVETVKAFQEWAAECISKLHIATESIDESEVVTIPKLLKTAPRKVSVGNGGYVLEMESHTNIKVVYKLTRLLDGDIPGIKLYVSLKKFPGTERRCMVQMGGNDTAMLEWGERSEWVDLSKNNPLSPEFLKAFAGRVIRNLRAAGALNEDKKEGGVKKSYVAGLNREEKAEMKREIKRFSQMDHRDKAAYPDDWTADQKYKARLKKKGKTLPRSSHTDEYHRRYGK